MDGSCIKFGNESSKTEKDVHPSLELSFPDDEDDLLDVFDSQESIDQTTESFLHIQSQESGNEDSSEEENEEEEQLDGDSVRSVFDSAPTLTEEQIAQLEIVPDKKKRPVKPKVIIHKKDKNVKSKRKSTPSKWVRVTKVLTEESVNKHKFHLLLGISHHYFVYQFTKNELIQHFILSILPSELTTPIQPIKVGRKRKVVVSDEHIRVENILNWFHDEFTVHSHNDITCFLSDTIIIDHIQQRKLHPLEGNIVFLIVCNLCGIIARFIGIIEANSVHVPGSSIEHAGLKRTPTFISQNIHSLLNISNGCPLSWIEFLNESISDWNSVNILTKEINKPSNFELQRMIFYDNPTINVKLEEDLYETKESPKKRTKKELSPVKIHPRSSKAVTQCDHKGCIYYCIALYERMMFDVSWRYSGDWLHAKRNRLIDPTDDEWWKETLEVFLLPGDDYTRMKDIDDSLRREIEEAIPLPNTLVGYQKHPLYCLEKQVGKYQVIHPPGLVTKFKDQNVYLRSHLHNLHSIDKWLEKGRSIKPEELSSVDAVKEVDSIKASLDPFGDHKQTKLYGRWQTKLYEPPILVDGERIPRNQYGNMYLYSPWMLPKGTIHLNLHNSVCRYFSNINILHSNTNIPN